MKRFPNGVTALDHVDLVMKRGEIHAILGENGAGKTTLMNILFGILQPDEGEIYLNGEKVVFRSPLDAINKGIGMVHQHRRLIAAHTVLENIILGHPNTGKFIDKKKSRKEVEELCRRFGFKIDLDARVWQLSAGEKQLVEIVRALYRGAKILILDEPTSVLTPPEIDAFLDSIKAVSKEKVTLVPFVTHKLPEVFSISHRVTILRRGKVVKSLSIAEASIPKLAEYMVGRELSFELERVPTEPGAEILRVEKLSALNDKGLVAFKDVDFVLRQGEIFGVAGVTGNGQQELAETIMGLRKPVGGKIYFDGKDITKTSVLDRLKMGLAYIPPERIGVAAVGDLSLVDNVLLMYYFEKEMSRGGMINYKLAKQYTEKVISEFNVVAPGPTTKAAHLSGGNLQKLILGRVLLKTPKIIIANLPTQGLDIAAENYVRRKLLECKQKGISVVLISENLDEILQLSDRVAPIFEGRFVDILENINLRKEAIGAMIAGGFAERGVNRA
ncbi:MAG: ABC transporter ATP-binding protein [Candidatus Caldarchaeum sp.]|nr:ABC transporter ATP-binding protein [Candidatus Caldarchaeum sp.]MCX8200954.1 ABC transporter ATP-binding protein [Candidatus Caldarchaeum sp.]MDW8063027.1 ABC transporter ATP-binding protein [Candidatus Caldarchaeum sp.]MDW8434761.1 ABC transporter ATP-binding protein [Candidatus Caldarchaeum sp.]